MEKSSCVENPRIELIERLKSKKFLFDIIEGNELHEEEDYDDIQYIDLVYPPGSIPPIRNSVKQMSITNLNQIFQ